MAGNTGGGGVLEPILSLFKEKPHLEQQQFDLYKPEADYYRARADELESELGVDRATAQRILEKYERDLPGLEASQARDLDYLESLRPEGRQESRFASLIGDYMSKARAAAGIGLGQSLARQKASEAAGGNAPFASSSFRRRQQDLLMSNYEKALAEQEGRMRLANAAEFLRGYRPGAALDLSRAYTQYTTTPLELRRMRDALGAARSATTTQGLRSAIDTHYFWDKDNNWADYLSALGATGSNVLNTALQVYGAAGGMGGLGGGGGGGGGGGFGGYYSNPYIGGSGAMGGGTGALGGGYLDYMRGTV